MAKQNKKIPIGVDKKIVKNRPHAQVMEVKPKNPAKTTFRKPMALKQKAGTGGYENPQSAFQRDAHV